MSEGIFVSRQKYEKEAAETQGRGEKMLSFDEWYKKKGKKKPKSSLGSMLMSILEKQKK